VSPDRVHSELSLDLPAAHRGVRVARNVLRRFGRLQGMADGDVDSLALIVSELLANVIDHGGGDAAMEEGDLETDARMQLQFELEAHRWILSVTDQGGGDPDEVRRLLEETPALDDDRGRGLFLMRQMVDEVAVVKNANGRGLTLRATKRHGRE
jgi:anti-sigma regulatory factor (Ser/Thr protein kinase)